MLNKDLQRTIENRIEAMDEILKTTLECMIELKGEIDTISYLYYLSNKDFS